MRLLRRGYSFTDGINPVTNQLDAGLFFIAFQRDPRTGFIPVQQNLAADALNEYIRHTSSAHVRVPPGVGAGGFVGETLFDRPPRDVASPDRDMRGQLTQPVSSASDGTPRFSAGSSRMTSARWRHERDDEGREERVPKHHPQHLDHRDPRTDDRVWHS